MYQPIEAPIRVPAAPHVIRVKDVQPNHFAGVCVPGDARKRLRLEKIISRLRIKRFHLRERDAVFDDVVPDCNGFVDVLFVVGFDFEHNLSPLFIGGIYKKCHGVGEFLYLAANEKAT